ncbi:MAG: peptide chain release factor N(5)-glutamine methyltransferase [Roseburia sp.]|nr:peptide chain release factor N(5)-glutamine methyltransferase [Roseburia sp.]
MDYQSLYQEGRLLLEQAEIEEAAWDARLLLEFVCHTNRNTLLAHGDRAVLAEEEVLYRELLARRAEHVPLQQLTGRQEFMGLTFRVNDRVLIPRQDTEILVEEVMRELHDGMSILDMCTGSGCILISLLYYSNDCRGVGVDLSKEALALAGENAERLIPQETVCFLEGNLFEKAEGKYDVIVSNPPYIKTAEINTLMPEVRDYEPRMALDGGEDGLYFYRRIIRESRPYLNRGGRLYFEIGCEQAAEVVGLMAQAGFADIQVAQDFSGLDRVVYGTFLEETR